jgi:hypothetical protein
MEFLSDEWFTKVDELKAEAGDLNVPDAIKDVVIVVVVDADGEHKMHMKGGDFIKGHDDSAPATLTLQKPLAKKIFIELDQAAGMQAFMAGEIKLEGDMSKVMALQTAQPSDKQKELLGKIAEITN